MSGTESVSPPISPTRFAVGAVVGVVLLVGTYVLTVLTRSGQALENAALRGADQVDPEILHAARDDLGEISVYSLAAATLAVGMIGFLRHRRDLAFASMALIAVGAVGTQVLKRFVLPRPALVDAGTGYAHNSFPSGHTTIAMIVLLALLIVVPYRWRGLAMLVGTGFVLAMGLETVIAKWHRASDTIGGDAVALICACAASWWLARRGLVSRAPGRSKKPRVLLVGFLAMAGTAAMVVAALLLDIKQQEGDPQFYDADMLDLSFLGAQCMAAAGSIFTLLFFWFLWRRLEVPGGAEGGDVPRGTSAIHHSGEPARQSG